MGPEGTEELMSDDPWAEVRWMVDGFNEKRRKEFKVGWGVTVDETMIAWQGKSGPGGIPHMSCIHRKPDPLGCELKNACDCSSGSLPSPPPPHLLSLYNLPPQPSFVRCDDACGNSGGDGPHGSSRIYP